MAKLTPLKAVGRNCRYCNGIERYWKLKDDCINIYCFLYPFRFGVLPETRGMEKAKRSVLKSIRTFCMECNSCIDKWTIDNDCTDPSCYLFPYRRGNNPTRRGLGNVVNLAHSKPSPAPKNAFSIECLAQVLPKENQEEPDFETSSCGVPQLTGMGGE